MNFYLSPSTLFLFLLTLLFFISRTTIQELFHFFSSFTSNRKIVYSLTCIVFFPGTVLHEMAHFIMALMLMLRVREVKVFPEWEGTYIKLGKVVYEKKDFMRGIIVGIAPIIAGLLFFWFISLWIPTFQNNPLWYGLIIYSIFVVSTTMFSSKQDLIDIGYLIPVIIVAAGIVYILNIPIGSFFLTTILPRLDISFAIINQFLIYSLVIHVALIVLFKSYRKVFKR